VKTRHVVGVLVVLAAANAGLLYAMHRPHAQTDDLWTAMATATVPDRPDLAADVPAELRAQEGRRVTLDGVVFVLKGGVDAGGVRWCVLMPPSRFGCCGISCDPRPELSVHVDCANRPWSSDGRTQVRATVDGVLRCDGGSGSWCLWSLEDAVVRPTGAVE
jgi:hypothetical protein